MAQNTVFICFVLRPRMVGAKVWSVELWKDGSIKALEVWKGDVEQELRFGTATRFGPGMKTVCGRGCRMQERFRNERI